MEGRGPTLEDTTQAEQDEECASRPSSAKALGTPPIVCVSHNLGHSSRLVSFCVCPCGFEHIPMASRGNIPSRGSKVEQLRMPAGAHDDGTS